ncbi:ROK family protein [Phytoactinopolyspora mesophila]|uniref:ROK family protein n=1 Tax=Phytoactinopolyspora mesophila TaxID=2650750 RepID=A0A7K3M0I7_9ACTN|nr:ROK family protein [Phytoactinopolyspora mesophila]NDL56789.1 ROK family protein [Phytoactinopolyspora mesophila]
MTAVAQVVGVDLGGTKTRFVLTCEDLTVRAGLTRPTPALDGADAMLTTVVEGVRELVRARGPVAAVGIGTAGVVDHAGGRIVAASDSFSGWAGTNVVDVLRAELDVPVVLENDVNAFLYGERSGGAARGLRDVMGISLGTGVGGAIVLDGQLFRGRLGGAGEIGHVPGFGDEMCTCGQRGHLETLASGRAIARRYRQHTGVDVDAADVAGLARGGDPAATRTLAEAGQGVAQAALMVAGILDVHDVVVGGGVAQAWDVLGVHVRSALAQAEPVGGATITIRRGELGGDAAAIGAAALARCRFALPVTSGRAG